MSSGKICVFVSSSDRTRDVFLRVYSHFDRMWPRCPFDRYVGFTSCSSTEKVLGFNPVPSRGESCWAQELREQIDALPPTHTFVLLLLDDFLMLKPIPAADIERVLTDGVTGNLAYLRLKPVERSWVVGAVRHIAAIIRSQRLSRLSPKEPYYSSLQAALWRRDHLLACLSKAESIWQFEHIVPSKAEHWAVTKQALLYCHTVEKALWGATAPALFRSVGLEFDPGRRPIHPRPYLLLLLWNKAKFGITGYTWVRLKRALKRRGTRRIAPTSRNTP